MTIEGSCTRPLLVFLVDDEPAIVSTLAGILRSTGCSVRAFLSGSDLIACRSEVPPDAVITDFVMQPVDGLRVAAWVKNNYPRARIILITTDKHLPRRAGDRQLPFAVLSKPLDSAALIAAVHGIDLDEAAAPDSPAV